MSYNTDKNWFYELYGRKLHVWQWVETAATDTVGSYRVKLPSEFFGNQLIYPNEDITNGLRVEYTALYEPFISEAIEDTTVRESSSTISFEDGTGGSSRDIIDLGTSTATDFVADDKVRVMGSSSNDGDYTVVTKGTDGSTGYQQLEVAAGSFTAEAVGESITIYQIPVSVADGSVVETTHVNLNRLLSLAIVDYVKAQAALQEGNTQLKEYYMRDFYKKIADDQSNRRKISITFPVSNFAVR